jgi:hypothetical protein
VVFEFRIPADSISDSVFLGARHLNWMDKITSHVIQMNSTSRSLNSRVLDARASDSEVLDSMVSEASDMWVSEASDSRVSEVLTSSPWSRIRDLVSEARDLRLSWTLTFLGFDLGR